MVFPMRNFGEKKLGRAKLIKKSANLLLFCHHPSTFLRKTPHFSRLSWTLLGGGLWEGSK